MLVFVSDASIIGDFAVFGLASLLLVGALMLAGRRVDFGGGGSLVAQSILILVVASIVAAISWPTLRTQGFCDSHALGGANIDHAVELALLCGVFGSVALRALRSATRRYLTAALLVAAVLLGVCVVLVSFDSAAYTVFTPEQSGDMFTCGGGLTESHRVWYLYPVWGSAVALLLLQAVRAFRSAGLQTEVETGSEENDEGE